MAKQTSDHNSNSYRSILKGTSIFGGVQVFQILINIVRGKFVAMFLGPEGMGIASLFTASSNSIVRFSSLGLNLSFVKEIASSKDNEDRLVKVAKVAGRLIQLTGILGALVCALAAPWLSDISFGSDIYAWQFVILAVAVYLIIAGNGKLAILQGLHKVKLLSLASLSGAISGLLFGVPLYYFFGDKGIVPAIVVLALTSYIFYWYGLRRTLPKSNVQVSRRFSSIVTRRMISAGMVLLASTLINTLCTYAINIYIRIYGDLSDVGLFNAANSLTGQYTAVVFTAMALDYFPRLSAVAGDRLKMRTVVDRQMEIVAIIAAPLSLLLIITAPIVIRLLLTSQFLGVTELMRWLGLAILLKAIAYPLGYIAFAKDNRRLFFWLEAVGCNILYLVCSLAFYFKYGLMGLGYGAVAEQAACVVLYAIVNFKVYGYLPSRRAWREIVAGILITGLGFLASLWFQAPAGLIVASVILVIGGIRAFKVLKRLLNIEN